MGELRHGPRLPLEPLARLLRRRNVRGQHLDRDLAREPRVECPIDLSHPARAEWRQDFVGAEPGAGWAASWSVDGGGGVRTGKLRWPSCGIRARSHRHRPSGPQRLEDRLTLDEPPVGIVGQLGDGSQKNCHRSSRDERHPERAAAWLACSKFPAAGARRSTPLWSAPVAKPACVSSDQVRGEVVCEHRGDGPEARDQSQVARRPGRSNPCHRDDQLQRRRAAGRRTPRSGVDLTRAEPTDGRARRLAGPRPAASCACGSRCRPSRSGPRPSAG